MIELEVSQEEIIAAFQEEIKTLSSQNIMLRLLVRKQGEALDAIQKSSAAEVPVRPSPEDSAKMGQEVRKRGKKSAKSSRPVSNENPQPLTA